MGSFADDQLEYWEMNHNALPTFTKGLKNMSNTTSFVRRGKIYWAKVLGEPVRDYDGTGREWTFDFVPLDEKELKGSLKEVGVADRLRVKEGHLDDQAYMTLKQREKRADGSLNRRIEVIDAAGNPWPQDKMIGNESVVDVSFDVMDFGPKKYKGVYPRGIRVLEHVAYVPKVFDELSEDDEYYVAAQEAQAAVEQDRPTTGANAVIAEVEGKYDDLDDDIPM